MDVQEEAPSIAGVVDERSEELRTKQDFVESKKWRQLGADSISQTSQDSPVASVANSSTKMKPSKSIQKRHDSDSDVSPPRKRHDSDSDASPPRRRTQDLDASPPRKRNDSDSDASPPRRRHDSDASPPRKRDNSDSDASPPRRRKKLPSPTRIKADPDGDLSPERTKVENKRAITLDGKKAGLQTGAALQKEMEELRKKQHKEFSRVDKALTGQNAETAIRGSKLRQIAEKKEQEKEKQEKLATLQAAYSKWNKGLKQGQDQAKKLAEDLHEMSKPVARFAGDQDLEDHLRMQERDGDPMAQYLSKKKVQKDGQAPRPVYRGPADNPNRFAILPGYRWDGVDRSNGFEKKYYEMQNKGIAVQEDAYKWSVSDM